jgi:hypothetical protein
MSDTKELRQALGSVSPEEVEELLDRLEAAEKERDALRAAVRHEADCVEACKEELQALHKELTDLRVKIEAMEKQEPVCITTKAHLAAMENGADRYIVGRDPVFSTRGDKDVPLYLAPGAQGATPNIPEGYKLLPIEPQHETLIEIVGAVAAPLSFREVRAIYDTVLAAATEEK